MQNGKESPVQIALHSIKNILGDQKQINLFSEHDLDFSDKFGIKLEGKIDRFGIDLTETQSCIMEGILRGFTETGYQGNLEAVSKEELVRDRFSGNIPLSYKNIESIPKLKISQNQILDWSGVNRNSVASVVRALDALENLGMKQYCFYYDRLAYDSNGVPIKDKSGKWKKEEVTTVDTLFHIKKIYNGDRISYYEITPSSIFLDQRESYFMLVPCGWREEVRKLVGNKKSSSYTFLFLLFLRYQYELKRRKNESKPYKISWSSEEIAIAIKMPESVYKRQKKRTNQILDNAYEVALQLGYLDSYERLGYIDVLVLSEKKYSYQKEISTTEKPKSLIEITKIEKTEAYLLLEFFYEMKKLLDSSCKIPTGVLKQNQILDIQELLKGRNTEEIKELIIWSTNKPYWCSRLSTPSKLKKHFSEAILEMNVSNGSQKTSKIEENKKFANKIDSYFSLHPHRSNSLKFGALNSYFEIGNGVHQPSCLQYDDGNFKEKIEEILKKWHISLEILNLT